MSRPDRSVRRLGAALLLAASLFAVPGSAEARGSDRVEAAVSEYQTFRGLWGGGMLLLGGGAAAGGFAAWQAGDGWEEWVALGLWIGGGLDAVYGINGIYEALFEGRELRYAAHDGFLPKRGYSDDVLWSLQLLVAITIGGFAAREGDARPLAGAATLCGSALISYGATQWQHAAYRRLQTRLRVFPTPNGFGFQARF